MAIIIIHAHVEPEPETYSRWEDLDTPECPYCHRKMRHIRYGREWISLLNDLWADEELWFCDMCRETEVFHFGTYGDREVEMTKEEWEDMQAADHLETLLRKRYGSVIPSSIRDYWLNT